MDAATKQEIAATFVAYARAFRAADMAALDALMAYPIAYLGDGEVRMVSRYPVQPAELIARTGWHDTVDVDFEVVAASATKAHVILRRATRVRADGTPIEMISGFYALRRTPQGWRFFAVSDVTVPI